MRINYKRAKKLFALVLTGTMVLSNSSLSMVRAESIADTEMSEYTLLVDEKKEVTIGSTYEVTTDSSYYIPLMSTDFEDGDTWGFEPGGGTTAEVESEASNAYLEVTGNGNGDRVIIKTLEQATSDSKVLVEFDWKPEDVSTDANSSEVSIRDPYGTPLFRLVKEGGVNGEIYYGIGSAGTDLSATSLVSGVSHDGSWLEVCLLFDFEQEIVALYINDKAEEENSFVAVESLTSINYINQIQEISVRGNRASGNTLSFTTGLDNIGLYVSGEEAPVQQPKEIIKIESDYKEQHEVVVGTSEEMVKEDYLEAKVSIRLESDIILDNISVEWNSEDYNAQEVGTYTFTGELDIEGIPNVSNDNNIQAIATVKVVEVNNEIPEREGYTGLYYSDFGDNAPVTPPNWGFTTSNATVSTHEGDIAGNSTPKLSFEIVNQSGGRVATKALDTVVNGDQILITFDWYPGKVNDKGGSVYENGGEFIIRDGSNNQIFTVNNTNNSPLSYYIGTNGEHVETSFTDPLAWYNIEVLLDVMEEKATLTIVEETTGEEEVHTASLAGVAFDGTVASVSLSGVRTSSNNITWTTYLDNLGIYHVPIPDNRIAYVNQIPYHRVYVGETTSDIESIGLPDHVTVTLADSTQTQVPIEEWILVDDAWEPEVSGVYTFRGILSDVEELDNSFEREAMQYVDNRLQPTNTARQTEWLDRGVVALTSDEGIFISWRLLADEYDQDIKFNVYRNGKKINGKPLTGTNFTDSKGVAGDVYAVETLIDNKKVSFYEVEALPTDYLAIPMQKPEGGETATGPFEYTVNDISVGDLTGDGQYELIVKWYPTNAIDSSQSAMTGPTIFDAYTLDGTLLWRIDMGYNLTSGAHYHQFLVFDFNGDGKSEFLIKTADATTVYGVTDGVVDEDKVISVIGNAEDNGKWVNDSGKIFGGPEYITVFDGETGAEIDTIDFRFALQNPGCGVETWGDTWHNRSDRWLAGVAYLDGETPSAIYSRGYYERTTYVAYDLIDGKLVERWYFDSDEVGAGGGLGNHSLSIADVDNDGRDEIIAGSLVLDNDGTILYTLDGEMGRERGSHGDALHVGAFDPEREGKQIIEVYEDADVLSLGYHDGGTGETLQAYFASKDAGRGIAANITSNPGFEFWGTAGYEPETGGAIYNVQGHIIEDSFRDAGLSVNHKTYWTGDLLNELLDGTQVTKYNEHTGEVELVRDFGLEGMVSNNGTKANPSLHADILGDWREEIIYPNEDSTEIRIYSTTIPTEYRLYTLMHDSQYRTAIAWQNVGYNQPPHLSFYLGEDIRDQVLAGELEAPKVEYTNKPEFDEKNPRQVYKKYWNNKSK